VSPEYGQRLPIALNVATKGLQKWRDVLAASEIVRARIDLDTKERASAALADMGLSVSDAIRLLMLRIADEKRLPFEVKVPNSKTRRAMEELEAGKGKAFKSSADLLKDLGV